MLLVSSESGRFQENVRQALRDKCEELADDVRALSALVHALRGALVAVGVVKAEPDSPLLILIPGFLPLKP